MKAHRGLIKHVSLRNVQLCWSELSKILNRLLGVMYGFYLQNYSVAVMLKGF